MLSYIIPAKDEEKWILGCLRSLYDQKIPEEFEVIVVDNNSIDRTAEIVAANFPKVRIVHEREPGTNQARQRGFLEARGDILIFLDADVRLPPKWVSRVLAKIRSSPQISAVSAPYRIYDFPWYWNLANELLIYFIIYPWTWVMIDWLKVASQLTGGCMAIRRQALEKIGGFNVSFKFYGDDTGTAMTLKKHGHVAYSPRFWVYSSARRYNKKGVIKTILIYWLNYFWILFTKHPYSHEEEELVR